MLASSRLFLELKMKAVLLIMKNKAHKARVYRILRGVTIWRPYSRAIIDALDKSLKSQEIALIFTLTTSLLGIFILIHGFIRDYVGYGVARLEIYFLLTLSYALLGISSPGSSDGLQYLWIIQFGCTIGAYLNGMQYFTLFPNQFGFLIGYDFKINLKFQAGHFP